MHWMWTKIRDLVFEIIPATGADGIDKGQQSQDFYVPLPSWTLLGTASGDTSTGPGICSL